MGHLTATALLDTAVVRAWVVVCSAPRAGAGATERNDAPQVVLGRRGAFAIHRQGRVTVADPTMAVVFDAQEEYRASHPVDGGDECLALGFREDVHEEALGGFGGGAGRITPHTQLAARLAADDETALLLLAAVAHDLCGAPPPRSSPARADDVRGLLAANPSRRWRLDEIAQHVHCSPFHLARQFRRTTGETIGRHLLQLRLTLALGRIAEGETDLAGLAAELGFAHHSHLTARFRLAYGQTPTEVRRIVTAQSRKQA